MNVGELVQINIEQAIIPLIGRIMHIENDTYYIEGEQGQIFIEKTNKRLEYYMEAFSGI